MLSSSYRIPKQDIPKVIKQGKRFSSEMFDIKAWYDDNLEHSLFAVVISAKVDKKAIVRNTIRRKFKAAIYNLINDETLRYPIGHKQAQGDKVFRKGNYVFLIKNAKLKVLKTEEIQELIIKTL